MDGTLRDINATLEAMRREVTKELRAVVSLLTEDQGRGAPLIEELLVELKKLNHLSKGDGERSTGPGAKAKAPSTTVEPPSNDWWVAGDPGQTPARKAIVGWLASLFDTVRLRCRSCGTVGLCRPIEPMQVGLGALRCSDDVMRLYARAVFQARCGGCGYASEARLGGYVPNEQAIAYLAEGNSIFGVYPSCYAKAAHGGPEPGVLLWESSPWFAKVEAEAMGGGAQQ